MLVQVDHLIGVVHTTIGHLADMHQAVLMYADVNEGAEGGDIGHNAGQHHALADILEAGDVLVELEHLKACTRVKARLLQLFHDVLQGRHATIA